MCLDAGHGGKDPGAVGPTGLEEASVVLDVCHLIWCRLNELHLSCFLTRPEDEFITLSDRCKAANEWQVHYFISVHCNSDGRDAVGVETLYKSQKSKPLAESIQESLVTATSDRNRGIKHRTNLYVLNSTKMPAVLAEIGFISHPETEAKLKTTAYQNIVAEAIVAGITKYLEWSPSKPDEPLA